MTTLETQLLEQAEKMIYCLRTSAYEDAFNHCRELTLKLYQREVQVRSVMERALANASHLAREGGIS